MSIKSLEAELPIFDELRIMTQVETNFIGNIFVPFVIKLNARFLIVPTNFRAPKSYFRLASENQKLCKDPRSGRLYLCS